MYALDVLKLLNLPLSFPFPTNSLALFTTTTLGLSTALFAPFETRSLFSLSALSSFSRFSFATTTTFTKDFSVLDADCCCNFGFALAPALCNGLDTLKTTAGCCLALVHGTTTQKPCNHTHSNAIYLKLKSLELQMIINVHK
jgi:hypothetical protein